jgi:hypothetical protein
MFCKRRSVRCPQGVRLECGFGGRMSYKIAGWALNLSSNILLVPDRFVSALWFRGLLRLGMRLANRIVLFCLQQKFPGLRHPHRFFGVDSLLNLSIFSCVGHVISP